MPKGWFEPVPPPEQTSTSPSPIKSFGWFVLIALASGLAVVITAYILRGLLFWD